LKGVPVAKTIVLGHRGASAYAPENSLAAFRLAIEQGAEGIECDVHLTSDGEIVVIHDDTVDAITNGHGPIASMTLSDAKSLKLRHRNGKVFTEEHIPTLAEILALYPDRRLIYNVELKVTGETILTETVVQFILNTPFHDQILLSSFDRVAIEYLHRHYPHMRYALLYPPDTRTGLGARITNSTRWVVDAYNYGCEAIHPHYHLATPSVIVQAHDFGMKVNIWTLDDVDIAQQLIKAGIDGIITNDPAKMQLD
jgi:glycerophosphoryl diester phosphodiesterase